MVTWAGVLAEGACVATARVPLEPGCRPNIKITPCPVTRSVARAPRGRCAVGAGSAAYRPFPCGRAPPRYPILGRRAIHRGPDSEQARPADGGTVGCYARAVCWVGEIE